MATARQAIRRAMLRVDDLSDADGLAEPLATPVAGVLDGTDC